MLTGLHLLLTYTCRFECDHCFVYSSPRAVGTFTLAKVRQVLDEAEKIGTIKTIYFEGGEPTLFYPLMLEGIRLSRAMGFDAGIVSNAYGALSEEDAELWLRPLADLGISMLSISDDGFHYPEGETSPAKHALAAAKKLGIPSGPICIERPTVRMRGTDDGVKGQPVVGGGVMFRGRAVEKLTAGLPRRPYEELTKCPHEDLKSPSRVHVDAYGHVHLCQGICMGNMWETPLSVLVEDYDADTHPICAPLAAGGPARLAQQYDVAHEKGYVDECHFCYLTRFALLDRFPQYLSPRQVYGVT